MKGIELSFMWMLLYPFVYNGSRVLLAFRAKLLGWEEAPPVSGDVMLNATGNFVFYCIVGWLFYYFG